MDERFGYSEAQEIYDETKIKCLVKSCVYNIDDTYRKTEVAIKIINNSPSCSSYDTFNKGV